ncbi:hypothetical protein F4818DRAFT_457407 [Hypoxylon cercidicola]|nr:hypothetical protein F4818DRAFT_457407 [Hypoxylon cercidicola]
MSAEATDMSGSAGDPAAGAVDQADPISEPIFGHSSSYEPDPNLCLITVHGKSLGFLKSLISVRSTYFKTAFETSRSCTIPWEPVEWKTVSAYLHLLSVDQAIPIRVEEGLWERTETTVEDYCKAQEVPGDPLGKDIAQLKIVYGLHFQNFWDLEERLKRLAELSSLEKTDMQAGELPLGEFFNLIKVYHFCGLVGSADLAEKVKQIFLRYLYSLTTLVVTRESLCRLTVSSAEWTLLGNLRVSSSISDKFLRRFTNEAQVVISDAWKRMLRE